MELRQTGEQVAQLSCREHDRDLLCDQTTSHKGEGPRGRAVKPLCVIEEADEGLLLSGFGQQAQHRETDQESIRCGSPPDPECDGKRVLLRLRQPISEVKERRTQLLDRCERKLHLSLDPEGPDDPKLSSSLDRILEQGSLPDARLTMYHQHAATPGAHAVK
jgi:hypothetical protein